MSQQSGNNSPQLPARSSYRDQRTGWFDASLASLDPDTRQVLIADVQEFLRDWRSGLSFPDLHRVWQYKALTQQNSASRKLADRYNVKQIYVFGNKYRVVLSVDNRASGPCLYFIEAFKKQKDRQENDVNRAIQRVRVLWEGKNDEPG